MRRRDFVALLGGAAGWPVAARAKRSGRMRRIGVLMGQLADDPTGRQLAGLLTGVLAALGWHDGGNLHIDWSWSASGSDRATYDKRAADLVALDPDVIVATSSPLVAAARRQTGTIAIVFASVTDPLGQGFVESLAHPGGNVTGFTNYDPPMAGKWLEMLTQITPPATRAGILYNPATAPYAPMMMRAVEQAAPSLHLTVHPAPCRDAAGIAAVMAALARDPGAGLVVLPDISAIVNRRAIVQLAARYRLPTVYPFEVFVKLGGLMFYGTDNDDLYRRAATYVDRILKGAKPADLPVQNPAKFELAINLKTAKALGVTVAPSLLAAADSVIG